MMMRRSSRTNKAPHTLHMIESSGEMSPITASDSLGMTTVAAKTQAEKPNGQ